MQCQRKNNPDDNTLWYLALGGLALLLLAPSSPPVVQKVIFRYPPGAIPPQSPSVINPITGRPYATIPPGYGIDERGQIVPIPAGYGTTYDGRLVQNQGGVGTQEWIEAKQRAWEEEYKRTGIPPAIG